MKRKESCFAPCGFAAVIMQETDLLNRQDFPVTSLKLFPSMLKQALRMRSFAANRLNVFDATPKEMTYSNLSPMSILIITTVSCTPFKVSADLICLRSTYKVALKKVGSFTCSVESLEKLYTRQLELMQEMFKAQKFVENRKEESATFNNTIFNIFRIQNIYIILSSTFAKNQEINKFFQMFSNDFTDLSFFNAIVRTDVIKFIEMNVMTASKLRTIKDKKNQIMHSAKLQQSNYITPSKPTIDETPIKSLDSHFLQKQQSNFSSSAHLALTQRKEEKDIPQNALLKKCFTRGRTIKSIKQLGNVYQSKILSKSKYRFKPDDSMLQSSFSNRSDSVSAKKKNFLDKIPKNIFATEQSIIENCSKSRSKSKDLHRSFSQSKIIKNSIIRYE